MKRTMVLGIALATALVAGSGGPAAASEQGDAMVPLKQFMETFNRGDWKGTLAACAETTAIVDNIPPHEWHGAGACERWGADLQAYFKTAEISDARVALSKPKHVDITGDRAYVVVPTTFSFKLKGKAAKQMAGQFTVALVKSGNGWQMTGWAWADQ